MPGSPIDQLAARLAEHEQCCREMLTALNALAEFLPNLTLPSSKDMVKRDEAVTRVKAALYRAGSMWS